MLLHKQKSIVHFGYRSPVCFGFLSTLLDMAVVCCSSLSGNRVAEIMGNDQIAPFLRTDSFPLADSTSSCYIRAPMPWKRDCWLPTARKKESGIAHSTEFRRRRNGNALWSKNGSKNGTACPGYEDEESFILVEKELCIWRNSKYCRRQRLRNILRPMLW